MKETLSVIKQLHRDGVIGLYAVGGAVGATFYLEPMATLDVMSLSFSSPRRCFSR